MPGKTSQLTPRQAQKQLLIFESELNRTLLGQEMTQVNEECAALAKRLRSSGTIARIILEVITNFRHRDANEDQGRQRAPRRWFRVATLFRLATGAWRIYRTWRKG